MTQEQLDAKVTPENIANFLRTLPSLSTIAINDCKHCVLGKFLGAETNNLSVGIANLHDGNIAIALRIPQWFQSFFHALQIKCRVRNTKDKLPINIILDELESKWISKNN